MRHKTLRGAHGALALYWPETGADVALNVDEEGRIRAPDGRPVEEALPDVAARLRVVLGDELEDEPPEPPAAVSRVREEVEA